ncbi:hypothetical protein EYF80_030692 [Liparis tanakae]|uniref:Uncharacterized protein n=1 Tax=Liparis tanakae TaxID=230148 RepID=A0A4Z2GZM3_9TELE|nr:hypothetical protein EYF80_030692 [Liparis tanakae]
MYQIPDSPFIPERERQKNSVREELPREAVARLFLRVSIQVRQGLQSGAEQFESQQQPLLEQHSVGGEEEEGASEEEGQQEQEVTRTLGEENIQSKR